MRVLVVVSSDVEANPAATVFHVLFECRSLFRSLRKVVEPEDQTVRFEIVFVELGPVGGGIQYEVMFRCQGVVESECVVGGFNVIRFDIGRVERQDLEGWLRRAGVPSREDQGEGSRHHHLNYGRQESSSANFPSKTS